MSINQENGKIGEQEVVDLVCCPNCGKKMVVEAFDDSLYYECRHD